MELTLNVVWMVVATAAFASVIRTPRRSAGLLLAILCALALLFPIISASDDLNTDRAFNDPAAAVVVMLVLLVAFVAIARVRTQSLSSYAAVILASSDPRSPPAR